MSRLPDFLIAGAPRCGSTTLYRMLDQHPSVFMARPKEIGFFNGRHWDDVAWYAEHFSDAGPEMAAGEATPWYLHDPVAVDQMEQTLPEARIIVILRDPVSRAYSHYWMAHNRGRAEVSFEDFIESSKVLDVGCYAKHLDYLTDHFARENVLVVFQEELKSDPRDLYTIVCKFIGVDGSFVPSALGETVNPYVEFRSLALRRWAKTLPSSMAVPRRVLGRLNTRKGGSYPPMSQASRMRLARYYEDPNTELANWLDRDLPGWTSPATLS
jgi:hypothetical protein